MGRGFKKPSGQLSPLRRGNSTQGEENAGGESLPADPGAAVADAKVSEKVDGANDHQHRPRSRGRRSKSSMASIAGSDERNSAVASGDGGKSQKLVWSPNQRHIVAAARTPVGGNNTLSSKSLLLASSSSKRLGSPKSSARFLGQGSPTSPDRDRSPNHSRSGSRHVDQNSLSVSMVEHPDEDARSASRVRLLPLDRRPVLETPRSHNHYQVPDLLLQHDSGDEGHSDEDADLGAAAQHGDSRSFITKQVDAEVMRILTTLDDKNLHLLRTQRQQREAATLGEEEVATRPLTLEEAKLQLIQRNKARGIEEQFSMSGAGRKAARKVSKTSERLLKTRHEAKTPIKNISVRERNAELDNKLDVYRRDDIRRAELRKSLENLKALEIEQRGGVDWVRGNISKADHGEYRYWNEMEKLVLRTAEQTVRLSHHRKVRREHWLKERDDLHEMLRIKEEKRLAMKAQKERELLLHRLEGKQSVLFPAFAAAARIAQWGKAIVDGRIQREYEAKRRTAVKVIQKNLSTMMWRRQFNQRCKIKAFMKRHSWKIMMKVSIQRKRRGADVIATSIREAMSKNKTMDAMQRYKYKVVTAQRRSKQMLTYWRSQFSCMCKYWDDTIKKKVSGQLAAPTSSKGKKGASTGKGSKGGGASGSKGKTPPTTGTGSRAGKGGKKGGASTASKPEDGINYLLVPASSSSFAHEQFDARLRKGRREFAEALAIWRKDYRDWFENKRPLFLAEEGAMALLRGHAGEDGEEVDAPPAQASDHDVARDIEHHSSEYIKLQESRQIAASIEKIKKGFNGLPIKWSDYREMSQSQRDSDETYRAYGPPRPVLKLLPSDQELTEMFQSARASESAA